MSQCTVGAYHIEQTERPVTNAALLPCLEAKVSGEDPISLEGAIEVRLLIQLKTAVLIRQTLGA